MSEMRIDIIDDLFKTIKKAFFSPITEVVSIPRADSMRYVHSDYKTQRGAIRDYQFMDLTSFIEYCKSNIEADIGGIFICDEKIIALHDLARPDGSRATYSYGKSKQFSDWLNVKGFDQKQFREFLEERMDEFSPLSLYEELAKLKLNAVISYNADLDDDHNYRLVFEEKQAKGSSEIPKKITVTVPVYENQEPQEITFRVKFGQPKAEGQRPLFSLEPVGLDRLLRQEMKRMADTLKEHLSTYKIYFGSPSHTKTL